MCMLPHHMSNPSVSNHANSASSENHLLEGDSPQPYPRHDVHDRVLSNPPTYRPYMKKSVRTCTETVVQVADLDHEIAILSVQALIGLGKLRKVLLSDGVIACFPECIHGL